MRGILGDLAWSHCMGYVGTAERDKQPIQNVGIPKCGPLYRVLKCNEGVVGHFCFKM